MTNFRVETVAGKIAVPGGEVGYRRMGSGGVPLILVHGGPGVPSDIQIKVPTLVIGGEFDEAVPAHLADIARRIPDSEHVTQAGAGHMTYLEETPIREQYVSIIRDYLARIELRART